MSQINLSLLIVGVVAVVALVGVISISGATNNSITGHVVEEQSGSWWQKFLSAFRSSPPSISIGECTELDNQLCEVEISWYSPQYSQLTVQMEGGGEVLVACLKGKRTLKPNWIQANKEYTFRLHTATSCHETDREHLLLSETFTWEKETENTKPQESGPVEAPTITIGECKELDNTLCELEVAWNSPVLSHLTVELEEDEKIFDCGTGRKKKASWIQPNKEYLFRIYEANSCHESGREKLTFSELFTWVKEPEPSEPPEEPETPDPELPENPQPTNNSEVPEPPAPAEDTQPVISIVGEKERVWRARPDLCAVPDGPLHMWKDNTGRTYMSIPHSDQYRVVSDVLGGEFEISNPNKEPELVWSSLHKKTQSLYDSRIWLYGYWTDDGKDIYSLGHHEWYHLAVYETPQGKCLPEDMEDKPGKQIDGWISAIHHMTSNDGGATFRTTVPLDTSLSSNSRRMMIIPEAYKDKPVPPEGITRYGFAQPSNVVKEGDYYYFLVGSQEIIGTRDGCETCANPQTYTFPRRRGLMLWRTNDITKPGHAQWWDGDGWTTMGNHLRIGRGHLLTHVDGEHSEAIEGADSSLMPMSFNLKWNPKHQKWIIFGHQDAHKKLAYITTDSLANPELSEVMIVDGSQNTRGWFGTYPTLVDPTSSGYVFQEVNNEPYLYYTFGTGEAPLMREIWRVKLKIE